MPAGLPLNSQGSDKPSSSCGPTGSSLAESGWVNVQAKQSVHHDLSMFTKTFDPDVLKPHEENEVVCHRAETTCNDTHAAAHLLRAMQYELKEIKVCVTGEIRWKEVWPNNTSIQKPCPHVETIAFLKAMGTCSTRVFISPNMAVVEIYNTFPGKLGFISEEDLL